MASANILAGFKPETVELLHSFAAYVDEIDGTEATPTELALSLIEADGRPGEFQAEQIVGAVLAEHRRFQRWLRDRRTVLMQDGWQAWAVRNARAGRTAAFAVRERRYREPTHSVAPYKGIRKGTESTWLLTILRTYQRQRDYEEDQ